MDAFIAVRRKTDEFEHRGNALMQFRRWHAAKPPVQPEKFRGSQPLVKPEVFRQKTDFASYFHFAGALAEQECFAARRLHQSKKHLDRSALARAVWTEETKNRPARYIKGQFANSYLVPVLLAQILSLYRVLIRFGQLRLLALTEPSSLMKQRRRSFQILSVNIPFRPSPKEAHMSARAALPYSAASLARH